MYFALSNWVSKSAAEEDTSNLCMYERTRTYEYVAVSIARAGIIKKGK